MEKEDNDYKIELAKRLRDERRNKGMTIDDLAKQTEIQKQTLNYAELNKSGRGLTVKNLIKVADVFGVSLDYLLGRVETKTGINETSYIEEWSNSTLGSLDRFMDELKNQEFSNTFNLYIFVVYVKDNIMKDLVDKRLKDKIKDKQKLNTRELYTTRFLARYARNIWSEESEYYEYLDYLVRKYLDNGYDTIIEECNKLDEYNRDRRIRVNFSVFENFQKVLKKFEEYMAPIIQAKLTGTKENMINKIVKDNEYFNRILQYFEEVNSN